MAHYLLQVAYSTGAWSALVGNPHDRIDAIRPVVERLGGKVIGGWMSFGDYDTVAIIDLPTNVEAAAFSMAVAAGGSCKSMKTTPLLTAEETVKALKTASNSGYKPISVGAAAGR